MIEGEGKEGRKGRKLVEERYDKCERESDEQKIRETEGERQA